MTERSTLQRYKDRLAAFFNRFRDDLTGDVVGKRVVIDNRTIDARFTNCEIVYLGGRYKVRSMHILSSPYLSLYDAAESTIELLQTVEQAFLQRSPPGISLPLAIFGPDSIASAEKRRLEVEDDKLKISVEEKNADGHTLEELLKMATKKALALAQHPPLVPVYCESSAHCFVEPSKVEPWMDPSGVMTSVLSFGKKFDLLGLSNDAFLINQGIQDMTDCLDSAIRLAKLYCLYEGKVYPVAVENLPTNSFAPSHVQADYKEMLMQFDSPITLDVDDNTRVTVNVSVSGRVNLEYGTIHLVANAHPGVKWLGYTLKAERVNPNRLPRNVAAATIDSKNSKETSHVG